MTILIRKCTYLTFDLAVTLIRSFRCGIHPGALCHSPKNISSRDAEHQQKMPSKPFSRGLRNYRLQTSLPPLISKRTPDSIFVNAWHPG